MGKNLLLTTRDNEILDALTLRIRVLSIPQIARTWWQGASKAEAIALERIKILERSGLVTRFIAMAHPELTLRSPLIVWEPGKTAPDFGAVSYRLKSRWTKTVTAVAAVIATRGAGNRFGGSGGRFPRESEHTHDLHLGGLFLRYRQEHPELIQDWISEESLRAEKQPGDKLPDALIRSVDGERVVEFGGAYSKEKLSRFHKHCAEKLLPYEIW